MAAPRTTDQIMEIASPRTLLSRYLVLYLVLDALALLALVILATQAVQEMMLPYFSSFILVNIFLALLCLVLLLFLGATTLFIARRRFSSEPALVINRRGIMVHGLAALGDAAFSWEEISALYASGEFGSRYLAIRLKEQEQFLARFPSLPRTFLRWLTLNTGSCVNVPQWFLPLPAAELLPQIQQTFTSELRARQIRIKRGFVEQAGAVQ